MELIECNYEHLDGSNCYCSDEAAETIREGIGNMPVEAVHRIGGGDWHYISLFWCERLTEDFSLVLFDKHPDDQEGAFGSDLLSCGNWVLHARRLPLCREVLWNPEAGAVPQYPIYLSVDLDVLSHEFAHTDWDQGDMGLGELCSRIGTVIRGRKVLGVDICGGLSASKGGTPEDEILNSASAEAIASLF